jgi:LAO/AO transport system kinase
MIGDIGDDPLSLAQALVAGDRSALARAITLVESHREADRHAAVRLLDAVAATPGASHRIGISGPPGSGKSTFIDAIGMTLLAAGHRVAVLAIDPSSMRTGGSILGDKTRMARLSREHAAFIRPSPAQGVLGGVAARTSEVMRLCEAAGFDRIVIETVGVGQSEIDVADLVDTLVVLVAAGGGDELQGIKRGLLECTDVLVVPKADGDHVAAAARTRADYAQALAYIEPRHAGWTVPSLECSVLENRGMGEVLAAIDAHREALQASGAWEGQRRSQRVRWTMGALHDALRRAVDGDEKVQSRLQALAPAIESGTLTPEAAAAALLAVFRGAAE